MTFSDLVNRVALRTNITSTDGLTIIGTFINDRYRRVMSGIGLQKADRTTVTATTTSGNRDLVFNCEKILSVYDANFTPPVVLHEFTLDELLNMPPDGDPTRRYAIKAMGASTVTLYLGGAPTTSAYVYTALAQGNLTDLSGTQVPAFSADYHDVLYIGGLADQLMKMEKYDFAKAQEKLYTDRLGELRLFYATSAYLQIYQGKNSPERLQNTLV